MQTTAIDPDKVRESLKKINALDLVSFGEPMSAHCTFRCGGPADLFGRPRTPAEVASLAAWARAEGWPVLVIGGGANILPADRGIRGLVIDLSGLAAWQVDGSTVRAGAGLPVSELSARCADHGLGGLDFIYAMPGSTGGAIYMNARCYDHEISQVLSGVSYLDEELRPCRLDPAEHRFAYKDTPFMHRDWIILEGTFSLQPAAPRELWQHMKELEADRRKKGHFALPCAGSVFKNNHAFGQPSGKIIDSLGLRGTCLNGARISDQHANIMVNAGGARAADLKALMDLVRDKVRQAYGHELEPEVVLVGDWAD